MQSNNPIYEGGAIYETMPGEAFKSLLNPSSVESLCTPHTPLAESATRYVFDVNITAPNVPPPRKSSICQLPMLKSVEEILLIHEHSIIFNMQCVILYTNNIYKEQKYKVIGTC